MSLDAAYPPVIELAPPASRGRLTGSAVAAANLGALVLLTGLLRP